MAFKLAGIFAEITKGPKSSHEVSTVLIFMIHISMVCVPHIDYPMFTFCECILTCRYYLALFPGHSQILSCSCGENLGVARHPLQNFQCMQHIAEMVSLLLRLVFSS